MNGHTLIGIPEVSPVVSPVVVAASPAADVGGVLVDVLGSGSLAPSSQSLTLGAEEGFKRFLFKNNGVLFENDYVQIGIKSEYKKNLGMYVC